MSLLWLRQRPSLALQVQRSAQSGAFSITHRHNQSPRTERPVWGLLADTHFKEGDSLQHIIQSTSWAVEHFEKNGVSRVFLLGDILNTRQMVHVGAQSAAMKFIGDVVDRFPAVHVIVGNHDMHLRHSRQVTSLDVLGLSPFSSRLTLHKEMELVRVDGVPVLMLPYHQDEAELYQRIKQLQEELPKEELEKVVAMAHLSVSGAISNRNAGLTFEGFLDSELFSPFQRTFSGHFHSHQTLSTSGGPVTYVGSPLQFNFGDLNDIDRGAIIYSPEEDHFELTHNPHAVRFVEVSLSDVLEARGAKKKTALQELVQQRFVLVRGLESRAASVKELRDYEKARTLLLKLGALNVRRGMQTVNQLRRETAKKKTSETPSALKKPSHFKFADLLPDYLQYRQNESKEPLKEELDELVGKGKSLMEEVDVKEDAKDSSTLFEADIKTLTIENFLGVGETQVIDFESLPHGVWYIQGANGSGKSTMAEAITWCLFGQLIRSDTKADYVINDKGKKNCRVRIDFQNGRSIERFRKHAELGGSGFRVYDGGVYQETLDLGSRDAAQQTLESLLGIDFQNFTRTVCLADDTARTFVTASPMKRRQIVEDLLGHGRFEQYLLHTRALHRDVRADIQVIENELSHFDRNLHEVTTRLAQYEQAQSHAKQQMENCQEQSLEEATRENEEEQRRKDSLTEQHRLAVEASQRAKLIQSYRAHVNQFQRRYAELTATVCQHQVALSDVWSSKASDQIHHSIQALERCIDRLYEHLAHYVDQEWWERLEAERAEMTRLVAHIKEKSDIESPASGTNQSEEDLEQEIRNCNALIETLTSAYEETVQTFYETHQLSETEMREMADQHTEDDCQRIIQREQQLTLELDRYLAHKPEARSVQIAALQREADLYEELVEQEKAHRESIQLHVTEKKKQLGGIQKEQDLLSFWELAFGRGQIPGSTGVHSMRDYVFQDSLSELNATLKQSLEFLCDDGVHMHDLDTSLDANFAFTGSEYGKRSSGERRRTALALFFALVDLTRARSSHQTQFLILDEIFDALDAAGQEAAHRLIQRLHQGTEYSNGIKKVFVITHSPITAGLCHTLKVEKSPTGTQFHPHPIWSAATLRKE